MKQVARKIITILFILTAVGYLINLAVDNPYTYKLIRTLINERVEKQTDFAVNFQAISVRAFPPGVDLYGLKVWTHDQESPSLLESSHIRVRLSVWALLMGEFRLGLAEVNELSLPRGLDALVDRVTKMMPPDSRKDPEPIRWPPDWPVFVERVKVINANVDLPVRATNPNDPPILMANLRGWNVEADFYNWQDWQLQTEVQSLNLHIQGKHLIQDGAFKTSLSFVRSKIKTKHLSLKSHDLNLSGRLDLDLVLEKPSQKNRPLVKLPDRHSIITSLEMRGALDVTQSDFSVLGRYLAVDQTSGQVDGRVNIDVRVPLAGHAPVKWSVAGQGKAQGAQLSGFQLFDSETTFTIDADKITFPKLDIIKGKNFYGEGEGYIAFDDALNFEFKAKPEGLPFTVLLDAVTVKDFNAVETAIHSKNLLIKGTGFPFHLDVTANAELRELDFPILNNPKKRFSPPHCQIDIRLAADSDAIRILKNQGTCSGQSDLLRQNLETSADPGAPEHRLPDSGYRSRGSPIIVDGIAWFGPKGMDLNFQLPGFDAALISYYPQLDLEGQVNVQTKIHGPYDDLLIETKVESADLRLEKLPLGEVQVDTIVTVKNPQLLIPKANISPNSGGYLRLSQSFIAFDEHLNAHLQGNIHNINQQWIQSLMQSFAPEHSIQFGIRRGNFDLRGPLTYPLAYQGKLSLQAQDLVFDNTVLFTQLNATIVATESEFTTRRVSIALDRFHNELEFSLNRQKPFIPGRTAGGTWIEKLGASPKDHFRLKVTTRPDSKQSAQSLTAAEDHPDTLGSLPFVGDYLKQAKLEGDLDIKAVVEGTFDKMEGNFDAAIKHPRFMGSRIGPIRAKGFLDGTKINIPILTYSGDAMIGRLNLDVGDKGIPYEWYLHFNRMDLRSLGTSFFWDDPRNFAYFTGNWDMRGKFTDFWRSQGNLRIEDIQVNFVQDGTSRIEKFELHSEQPVTIEMDKKGWVFKDNQDLFLKGREINLHIALPSNRPPAATHVVVEGNLDVAVLKRLLPAIESARGEINFNLAVKGNLADPELTFEMTDKKMETVNISQWEPLSIGITDLSPAFTNIRINIRFADDKLEIRELSADKGKEGRLSAQGRLDFAATDPEASKILINMRQAEIRRFPIAVLKTMDLTLSGDLALSGNQLPLTLAGNITIDKAASQGNFDIRNQILEMIRRRRFNAPSAPESPILNLALQVNADDSIYIKNRNIVASLSGNLSISGNEQAPVILGQVQIPKGQFSYKRVFEIQRGTITFDEAISPPDPKLDIMGIANVSTYRVMVTVTGQVSDPKVALAIDPPTRQDGTPIEKMDILLLLTSGKLPDQERSLGTSQNAASAASSEALNLVIGQFEEPIEKIFDMSGQTVIRQVYLDTYPSEFDGRPVARLNLPINLTEDLNFVLQVDDDSNMKISSEYSLHEGISVSGSFDKKKEDGTTTKDKQTQPADTGVDLKFRFSFP